MSEKQILFLRHGQTDWNVEFRYQGRTDVPLNAKGEFQARNVSHRLASWKPDSILISPLVRAYRTAEIVTGAWKNPPEMKVLSQLQEISFGNWEGHSIGDVISQYKDIYNMWRENPGKVTPPGGESFEDALKRAYSVISAIDSCEGQKCLVVTHGGLIRVILSALLDIPSSVVWKFRLGNCALTGVSLWEGSPSLLFLNDCLHDLVDPSLISQLPMSF